MTLAFIEPPRRIPLYLRWGLWVVKRRTGRDLLPPRLLAWYPRAAIGSAVLEALIAHDDGRVSERMLKMVRMAVSFRVECPFCMGFNSENWDRLMTEAEVAVVQGVAAPGSAPTLSEREILAIEYAQLACATPLEFTPEFGRRLSGAFTEREIVVLATTAAQVNYLARLTQALGCPAAG
ncbi:MAG: hypothetical protein ABI566_00310 [Pseudolysinimonas sp.]